MYECIYHTWLNHNYHQHLYSTIITSIYTEKIMGSWFIFVFVCIIQGCQNHSLTVEGFLVLPYHISNILFKVINSPPPATYKKLDFKCFLGPICSGSKLLLVKEPEATHLSNMIYLKNHDTGSININYRFVIFKYLPYVP